MAVSGVVRMAGDGGQCSSSLGHQKQYYGHGRSRAHDVAESALRLIVDAVHEGAEFARARRVTQLAQGFRFDLADTLTGDGKGLADLFQGVLAAILEAETHLDDLLLARGEGAKNLRSLVLEVDVDDGFGGRDDGAILDEISEVRIFLFADGSLQ